MEKACIKLGIPICSVTDVPVYHTHTVLTVGNALLEARVTKCRGCLSSCWGRTRLRFSIVGGNCDIPLICVIWNIIPAWPPRTRIGNINVGGLGGWLLSMWKPIRMMPRMKHLDLPIWLFAKQKVENLFCRWRWETNSCRILWEPQNGKPSWVNLTGNGQVKPGLQTLLAEQRGPLCQQMQVNLLQLQLLQVFGRPHSLGNLSPKMSLRASTHLCTVSPSLIPWQPLSPRDRSSFSPQWGWRMLEFRIQFSPLEQGHGFWMHKLLRIWRTEVWAYTGGISGFFSIPHATRTGTGYQTLNMYLRFTSRFDIDIINKYYVRYHHSVNHSKVDMDFGYIQCDYNQHRCRRTATKHMSVSSTMTWHRSSWRTWEENRVVIMKYQGRLLTVRHTYLICMLNYSIKSESIDVV